MMTMMTMMTMISFQFWPDGLLEGASIEEQRERTREGDWHEDEEKEKEDYLNNLACRYELDNNNNNNNNQ